MLTLTDIQADILRVVITAIDEAGCWKVVERLLQEDGCDEPEEAFEALREVAFR